MSDSSAMLTRLRSNPREWVTAKVIQSHSARRYINRLDSLGFEYKVVMENRHVRILVREQKLDEVLEWFNDLSPPQKSRVKRSVSDSRAAFALMLAIPAGLFCGSVFAGLVGIPSPFSYTISGYCGIAAAILAYAMFATTRPQSRI